MRRPPKQDDSPATPITRQTLRDAIRLLGYLRPYRAEFGIALGCLFVSSLVGLGFPVLAGKLVDAVMVGMRDGVPRSWLENVNLVALGLMAVLAVQATFAFLRTVLFARVGEGALADLRRDTFSRMVRLSMSFHNGRRVGELASRIAADLTRIRDTLVDTAPHFLRQMVLLVGGVSLILMTSLKLTGMMLLTVPVLSVVAVVFGNRIRKIAKQAQDQLADSNVVVEETLHNIASVKAFTNEPYEQARYGTALADYVKTAIRGAVYEGVFVSFIVFALFGSIVFVLWYGSRLVLAGELSSGDLTQFILLTFYVAGAVGSFAELYSQIQKTLGASARVREILRETTEPIPAEVTPTRRAIRGEVRLDEVRFRYPSRPEVEVLRGVSLSASAGQRVALVGPSGAGKSTVVSLLLRLFEPEGGRILIDGKPATEYDLHLLRSNMAIVPQDVMLFGGTIAENIAYGKVGAAAQEIEEAARQANAHDFIAAFPEGYATRVGERGVQLSGGQRQRVAIARAILRDPAILLLDEATSALDSESERLVLEALDRLMEGRTSLVIAHRLSTVRGADRIYVLDQGRVVEDGTHQELLDRPEGVYRNLSLLQFDGSALASVGIDG